MIAAFSMFVAGVMFNVFTNALIERRHAAAFAAAILLVANLYFGWPA